MPKNSRRKKKARQHAVGKGERYMRAWRSTSNTPPRADESAPGPRAEVPAPAPADSEVDPVALGMKPLRQVQRLVEARGWVVLDDFHLDERGLVRNIDVLWDYAPAFGGVELPDDDEDVVPLKPTCRFSWDGPFAEGQIVIDSAGNHNGCERHRLVEHRLPLTEAGIAELPRLLTEVEVPSRNLDPEPYLDCLDGGPCMERQQREEQKNAARRAGRAE